MKKIILIAKEYNEYVVNKFVRRLKMSAARTAKRHMNLMSVIVFATCLLLVSGNTVFAIPYLQLDAYPAVYVDGDEESIVTTDLQFTLYALVDSTSSFFVSDDIFYIAVALVPDPGDSDPELDLGSYVFDDTTIDVVGDMTYGNPPLEEYLKQNDLPSHGVYDTYYQEISFALDDPPKTTVEYDAQDNPGGPGPDPGSLYYEEFVVDARGLTSGYVLHFDFYTQLEGLDTIDKFAPFSHDVLTTPVPASVILGMLGLGVVGLKLRKFA